jgi:hypothetical protein
MDKVTPRGKLGPRGRTLSLGGNFTLLFTHGGECSLMFRRTKGRTEGLQGMTSPWGAKITPGLQIHI